MNDVIRTADLRDRPQNGFITIQGYERSLLVQGVLPAKEVFQA